MNLRAWLPGISFSVLSPGVTHLIHDHVVRFLSSPSCGLEGGWFSPVISLLFLCGVSIRHRIITAQSDFIKSLNPLILLLALGVLQEIWNQIVLRAIESKFLRAKVILTFCEKSGWRPEKTMCSDKVLNKSVWRSCTKCFWYKMITDCHFGGISMIIQLFITHPSLPKMISCLTLLLLFY